MLHTPIGGEVSHDHVWHGDRPPPGQAFWGNQGGREFIFAAEVSEVLMNEFESVSHANGRHYGWVEAQSFHGVLISRIVQLNWF